MLQGWICQHIAKARRYGIADHLVLRLDVRSLEDEAVTIGNRGRINLADVTQQKLCVGVVAQVSSTTMRFELIGPNHIEACLLKAKVKTSATCKE